MTSPLKEKSFAFAVEIERLTQFLVNEKKEYVLSKQVLKSGTAIGTLIRESEYAASKADFINKLTVALKEANEIDFWLMLLYKTDYISKEKFDKLQSDCKELIAMLISSIKTSKGRMNLSFITFNFTLILQFPFVATLLQVLTVVSNPRAI